MRCKHIPSFSKETKRKILQAQNGYCSECNELATEVHHKLQNTETNRKLYPHFIQSIFNAVGLCHRCHEQKSHRWRVYHDLALVYEEYLNSVWSPYVGKEMTEDAESVREVE